MQTFIANLKRAIRNKETVSIGGGLFNTDELREVLAALDPAKREEQPFFLAAGDLIVDDSGAVVATIDDLYIGQAENLVAALNRAF